MSICKICQQKFKNNNGLGYHIKMTHKITTQEYYDDYIKKDSEGQCKCENCSNPTKFINLINGYRDFCSRSCSKLGKQNPNYGISLSEETKSKQREKMLGHKFGPCPEERKQKISKANKGRKHTKEELDKQSKALKGRKFIKEHKEKIRSSLSKHINGFPKFEHYSSLISWCEDTRPDSDDNRIINVRCTKCNEWFRPTKNQMQNRLRSIKDGISERNFYCSDHCKNTCSIYNRSIYPKGFNENERPYQSEWKQMIKERANNKCEICGESQGKLTCHHINSVKTHPHEVADIDNGILLCEKCDKRAHSDKDCTTGYLSSLIC